MSKYKFTIIYYLFLVVPFSLYVMVNFYLYIFTSDFVMSEKVVAAGAIALIMGILGAFVYLWESES